MTPPRSRTGARRRNGTTEPAAAEHLVRSASWHGVRAGDRVEVAATGIRGARWEFRAHVVNTRNGSEWVEVVGGRSGDRRIRTFPPERIYATTGRAGTPASAARLSLADAPQLPLE